MTHFFFEMINLLLHGSVLAQKRASMCSPGSRQIRTSDDRCDYWPLIASSSIWTVCSRELFSWTNRSMASLILFDLFAWYISDQNWIKHIFTQGSKTSLKHQGSVDSPNFWPLTYFLYINDFENCDAFDIDYIITILIFVGRNLKVVLLVNFHKNHQNGKIESVHIFQLFMFTSISF